MNKNTIIFLILFFILLAIINGCFVFGTIYLSRSILIFIKFSVLLFNDFIFGILLILLGFMFVKITIKICNPPDINEKDRHYKDERIMISFFSVFAWIIFLFGITVILFLVLKTMMYASESFRMVFQEYYLIAFSGAIGALWGVGLSEVMHIGNYIKYGKKYMTNIDMTKEVKDDEDWLDKETYRKNLLFWKKRIMMYSISFFLIIMVFFPELNKILDKIQPI